MEGFDRTEAVTAIANKVTETTGLAPDECRRLIEKIMDDDFAFMRATGVIVDDAFSPEAYYEDDEAFSYVAERLFSSEKGDETLLMDVLEGYFDAFEEYMSEHDLLSWD